MPYKSATRQAIERISLVVIIAGGMAWAGYAYRQQTTLDAALFDAADRSNVNRVHALLARGANPNIKWKPESPPVFLDYCKQAVGMDPRKSEAGRTPLMLAAAGGKLTVAKELLSARADVNLRDGAGHTALYLAAHSHRQNGGAIVLLLTKHGATLNTTSSNGKTTDLSGRNPKSLQAREQAAPEN